MESSCACFRMVHSRERQTAVGLWSVGQAALSVTCQSLFVIFVASDAGHRPGGVPPRNLIVCIWEVQELGSVGAEG